MSADFPFRVFSLMLADNELSGVFVVLAIVVALVLVGGGVLFARHLERKRTEGFQKVAKELGLGYYATGERTLLARVGHFQLFSQGDPRLLTNMLHGETNNVEMAIFDYQYTVRKGKNRHTHCQSVIYFRSPSLNLPYFSLRPEGFFDRIANVVGYQDIDFDMHPQFSKMYVLRGREEAAIREFFVDDLLSGLESQPMINCDAGGEQIVFYRPSIRIKPEEVRSFMEEGFGLYTLFRGEQADA